MSDCMLLSYSGPCQQNWQTLLVDLWLFGDHVLFKIRAQLDSQNPGWLCICSVEEISSPAVKTSINSGVLTLYYDFSYYFSGGSVFLEYTRTLLLSYPFDFYGLLNCGHWARRNSYATASWFFVCVLICAYEVVHNNNLQGKTCRMQ